MIVVELNVRIALAILGLGANALGQTDGKPLKVGDTAPPLTVGKWIKGEPVTQLGQGKVTVVEFWGMTCEPCLEGIPHLTAIAKKYAGKLAVAGIDSGDGDPNDRDFLRRANAFVAKRGAKMEYSVGLTAPAAAAQNPYLKGDGRNIIPMTYIVDQQGKVAWIGSMKGLEDAVQKVISGTLDVKTETAAEQEEAKKNQELQRQAFEEVERKTRPIKAAMDAKDYRATVAAIDAHASGLNFPQMTWGYYAIRFKSLGQYDAPAANAYGRNMVEREYKDNVMAIFQITATIAEEQTPIRPEIYDVAVQIARRSVELDKDEAQDLDLMAHIQFRGGHTREVIATVNRALNRAYEQNYSAQMISDIKRRLGAYRASL